MNTLRLLRRCSAVAAALSAACAGAEAPQNLPKPALTSEAEPGAVGRSFQVGRYLSLGAPDDRGASVALIGGRRVRLHQDGRIDVESTPSLEPLSALVEVSGKSGPVWVGASKSALFRFADPLGAGTLIHRSKAAIERVSAVPGGVAIRVEGQHRLAVIDVDSGKVLPAFTLGGALPADVVIFDSDLHGLASAGQLGFETRDAGKSWSSSFASRNAKDAHLMYGSILDLRDPLREHLPLEAQLKAASLSASFMVSAAEDPLAAAAARGVPAPDNSVVVMGGARTGLNRISLQTGAVLATTEIDIKGECRPFTRGLESVGVACSDGSVYPLTVGDKTMELSKASPSGSKGKLITSVDGGVAYDEACNAKQENTLCVRQVNGGFANVALPEKTVGTLVRPNGTVLVAHRLDGVVVVERRSHQGTPLRLAEWRGCPDANSVSIDEVEGGIRLVGAVACSGKRPVYGMFTKVGGAETSEPLADVEGYALGGGHVIVRTANEVRFMSRPGSGWRRAATTEPGPLQLSQVGFVAGDVGRLGWLGGFDKAAEAMPVPKNGAPLPKLVCKSGNSIGKAGTLYRPPFAGRYFPDAGDLTDVYVGLSTAKGSWLIQWIDTWDPGATVHELRLKAPASGEAYVSSFAARGESMVAMVSVVGGEGETKTWVLRRLAGKSLEREVGSVATPREIAFGEDGTAAWAKGRWLMVWPPAKPMFSAHWPEADGLTLGAGASRGYLFAPRSSLDAVIEIDRPMPAPADRLFDPACFVAAVPNWRGRARALAPCKAGSTDGRLVRIDLPAVVEVDGAASPESKLAAEVYWQPNQDPCVARMRTVISASQVAIVKVDLTVNRAESVDTTTGDIKELACRWEVPVAR